MTKRWFTSDLHLGHTRINELCNRPFNSVAQMNYEIVRRWNEVVRDEDTVYILGDLAMGSITDSLALVPQLNGNKILVPGNHDRVWSGYKQTAAKGEEMRRLYESVGLTIAPQEVTLDNGWKLCHFPTSGDSYTDDRYPEHRPTIDDGQWLIHGHVHNLWRVKGKQVNVGVDVWNFYPVVEESLTFYMDAYALWEKVREEINSGLYGPPPQENQEYKWLIGNKTSS